MKSQTEAGNYNGKYDSESGVPSNSSPFVIFKISSKDGLQKLDARLLTYQSLVKLTKSTYETGNGFISAFCFGKGKRLVWGRKYKK